MTDIWISKVSLFKLGCNGGKESKSRFHNFFGGDALKMFPSSLFEKYESRA
jgi:hypothetical protein